MRGVLRSLIIVSLLAGNLFLMPAVKASSQSPAPTTPSGTSVDPLSPACSSLSDAERAAAPACTAQATNPVFGKDSIIMRAASIVTVITGIASIFLIIIGSLKFITSAGNPDSVDSARKTVVYALVGLVVSLLAQGIIIFVINRIK